MKKAANIFLLVFYCFGTFCLPLGDFSLLQDIPEMYQHCKATEDEDMTSLDFITDHLVNIDGIFDKHDKGDEQKPHSPLQSEHHGKAQVSFINSFGYSMVILNPIAVKLALPLESAIQSDFIFKIFRPPMV